MATRALERFTRLGEPLGRADALRVLAAAARASGRDEAAAPFLDDALEIARAHSDPLLMAEVQRDRGLLLRDQGDADAAREALAEPPSTSPAWAPRPRRRRSRRSCEGWSRGRMCVVGLNPPHYLCCASCLAHE